MNKDTNGKVISYNFKKDIDENQESKTVRDSNVIDLRKNQISKMINDLASLNKKEEDLLEG